MTAFDTINTNIALPDKKSVVKLFLYIKFFEKDIKLTENELGILSIIAQIDSKKDIIEESIRAGYVKSVQSGENFISKFVTMGLVDKSSSGKRRLSKDFMLPTSAPYLAATIKICNIAIDESKEPS